MKNNLPELPRVLKKREADLGLRFRKWMETKKLFSSAWELKQTTKNSIPFSCVEQSQINWLSALSSEKGALIRVIGLSGEPDYVWGRNMPCHIFIKYPKGFYAIAIGTFLLEKSRSKRKSLTLERAKEIATYTLNA